VHKPDPRFLDVDDATLRKQFPKAGVVHVPKDALDRRELLERLEHGDRDEITRVQDQLGVLKPPEAFHRQSPRSPRHVRIGDDGYARQPAPFRNTPSR
jgi:hypothetical protein